MRYESTVTSLSWIPSEAVTGGTKAAFEGGFTRYDQPPPGELGAPGSPGSVSALREGDRFRFANVLSAWIETDDQGAIVAAGYHDDSGGHLEAGTRTASLVAVTPCKVAAVDASALERSALAELSGQHRREEA